MAFLATQNHFVFAFSVENESLSLQMMPESFIVPPVDFTCIRVEPNGDINLNWIPSVQGTGVFIEYQLFCLQSGMVPIATLSNINTSAFTHNGIGGNLASKDYYIATLSDCGGMTEITYSDTISSIFLEINDLGDGRVFVEWNPTHTPQLPGEALDYKILREYPTGNWQVRKLIPHGQFNYRDTIDICHAFINYQIEVSNVAGCVSYSNIEGDLLQDIINPYIPSISYVTVDTVLNNASVFWNQNQSSDTYGYIILKLINGFWENIDTVYGIGTTSYVDYNSIEDIQSETYAVAAFDSCIVNNVPPNYQTSAASEAHSTIFVESTFNICELELSLNWTTYVGWGGANVIDRYEVLIKKNDGVFEVLAEVPSDKAGYNYNGLEVNNKYCFYIRAVSSSNLYSYSNEICKFVLPPSNPDFHYLSKASYTQNDQVEVEFYTDSDASVLAYEVYKKGPYDFQFSVFETIAPTGADFNTAIDSEVSDRGQYEYKVGIIDSCNNTSLITPITKTIYLSLDRDLSSNIATLSWTEYEGFDGGVFTYKIYRGEDGIYDQDPIIVVSSDVRTIEDDLSEMFDSQGGFCYKVKAVESFNSYGFVRSAASNEVCLALEPVMHIPSAFVINGNSIDYRPYISLYDFDSYQMEIYDRWGSLIYLTNDIDLGWKGTILNGEEALQGVYVYRVTFKDVEGKRYEKTGTLALLKSALEGE